MLTLAMPQSEPVGRHEPLGLAHVVGEDARRQTLGHVVVQRHRLVEVVVAEHVQQRTERLGAHDLGLVGHRHDRRRARSGRRAPRRRATRSPPTTSLPPVARWRRRSLPRCRRRRRRRSAGRRACRRPAGRRSARWRRPWPAGRRSSSRTRVVHDQPAQAGAALAGGADGREGDAAHGQIEVGRRAPRWRRCCRRARGSAARSGTPRPAPRPGPCASTRWPTRWRRPRGRRVRRRRRRHPSSTWLSPSGAPTSAAARRSRASHASAVSGVLSDGFHSTGSPATSASAAFHDHTATGKLNAVMTAHGPIGCHVSISRWPGRSLAIVSPCSWRDSPTAKSQMSIISWTSPRPSERILPASIDTSSPRASLCSRSSSPRRRTRLPRIGRRRGAPRARTRRWRRRRRRRRRPDAAGGAERPAGDRGAGPEVAVAPADAAARRGSRDPVASSVVVGSVSHAGTGQRGAPGRRR